MSYQSLLEELNGQPQTLIAIAKRKLPSAVDAIMTRMDAAGFELRCTYRTTPSGPNSPNAAAAASGTATAGVSVRNSTAIKVLRIKFAHPPNDINHARQLLVGMAGSGGVKPIVIRTESGSDRDDPTVSPHPTASAAPAPASPVRGPTAPAENPSPAAAARSPAKSIRPFTLTPFFPMPALIAFGLTVLWFCAYRPPLPAAVSVTGQPIISATADPMTAVTASLDSGHRFFHSFAITLFRSQFAIQLVFIAAVIAHIVEAAIAWRTARSVNLSIPVTIAWTVQTFLWGYPSLGTLKRTAAVIRQSQNAESKRH